MPKRDHQITVVLSVKADNEAEARSHVATRLNNWFNEDLDTSPFPRGSLLQWNWIRPLRPRSIPIFK